MSGKHSRLRYYSSMEEATMVRVWREYVGQIPCYSENLPIFSDISHSMQQCGIRLNKQEVRRRINHYRNKYLAERSRVESNPEHVLEWRLYPIIDCLFHPERPTEDIQLAQNVLESAAVRVRSEQPDLPNIPSSMSRPPHVKFERDPDGCAFLEAPPGPPAQTSYLAEQLQQSPVKTEPKPLEADEAESPSAMRRTPLTPVNFQQPMEERMDLSVNGQIESTAKRRRARRSILPRSGQISVAQLEALRLQNGELERQNEHSQVELQFKERQYNEMEQTIDVLMHQQEVFLLHFDRLGFKSEA
ncbi:uncharacterized protein LOC117587668 [Drosophila guanche]|uniref:Uncharacterized protein n=1 Tax=Drosophila guanche TaxID=7266 RepID=A0A3B0KQA1_DROGU|nr:uncharacterized protein LOC117587668 [Drosophila guanche]SPP86048.1 Hypothetical predicted protein [Drosophila guanche]